MRFRKTNSTKRHVQVDDGSLYLFAYGSLKKHFYNEDYLADSKFVGKSTSLTPLKLLKTDKDPFPFLVRGRSGNQRIKGELYKISKETLDLLDKLEGSPKFYRKSVVMVSSGAGKTVNAVTYTLNRKNTLRNKKISKISEWTSEDEYSAISENLFKALGPALAR
jgi:gamma-glutamylcyclotransferase (GGCT)/AIG2-like uncharacterized protein YtfP